MLIMISILTFYFSLALFSQDDDLMDWWKTVEGELGQITWLPIMDMQNYMFSEMTSLLEDQPANLF